MTTIEINGGATAAAIPFREIWFVDFEFRKQRGEHPQPVCMVAAELKTGREIRLWRNDLHFPPRAPFSTGADTLVVAYAAAAEISCFLQLDWTIPANILDLYAEHRCQTNGLPMPNGNGIIGALEHRGLRHISAEAKEVARQLVIG